MPHKRAKRSVREQQRSEKGANLPPSKQSLSTEAIPKSLARVLNAAKVREDFKTRKRKAEDGETEGKGKGKRRKVNGKADGQPSGILPGESLQHYNKRVETDMRPLVRTAVQSSLAVVRGARKQETSEKTAKIKITQSSSSKHRTTNDSDQQSDDALPPPPPSKHSDRPKEFQSLSSSAPRRLNDIAQAPPELKRLPRGAATKGAEFGVETRDGVLSMAQKVMMEKEREKAISRYRQLKASRRQNEKGGEEEE